MDKIKRKFDIGGVIRYNYFGQEAGIQHID